MTSLPTALPATTVPDPAPPLPDGDLPVGSAPDAADPDMLHRMRDLAAARSDYEEQLGWPVRIDVDPGRLLMPTGSVTDVLVMPAALGRQVLAELRISMLAGPVTAEPGGRRWTFFTAPAAHCRDELAGELSHLDVQVLPAGALVTLPLTLDGAGAHPWVSRPVGPRRLPPWSAVVSTTRRCGDRIAAEH